MLINYYIYVFQQAHVIISSQYSVGLFTKILIENQIRIWLGVVVTRPSTKFHIRESLQNSCSDGIVSIVPMTPWLGPGVLCQCYFCVINDSRVPATLCNRGICSNNRDRYGICGCNGLWYPPNRLTRRTCLQSTKDILDTLYFVHLQEIQHLFWWYPIGSHMT